MRHRVRSNHCSPAHSLRLIPISQLSASGPCSSRLISLSTRSAQSPALPDCSALSRCCWLLLDSTALPPTPSHSERRKLAFAWHLVLIALTWLKWCLPERRGECWLD